MSKIAVSLFAAFVVLLAANSAIAQPDLLWSQNVEIDTSTTYLYDVIELTDGSFATVGWADSTIWGTNTRGALVAHLSVTGQVLWANRYYFNQWTTVYPTEAYGVTQLDSVTLRVVGYCMTNNTTRYAVVMDVGTDGSLMSLRTYLGTNTNKALDVTMLTDGACAVVGQMCPEGTITADMWVARFDAGGDTSWTRHLGGTHPDVGNQVKPAADGAMIVSGYTRPDATDDVWIVKIAADGSTVWSQHYGSEQSEQSLGLSVNASNEYYLAGWRQLVGATFDGYLVKVGADGNLIWGQTYNANQTYNQFRGVTARNDGGALCVGIAGASSTTGRFWIASINSNDQLLESWVYGNNGSVLTSVCPVSTGGYIACGQALTTHDGARGYVARIGALSGIRGTVRDAVTNQPITGGVHVGVIGATYAAPVNSQGEYLLDLAPATYDLLVSGPCIATDTLPGVTVLQDSIMVANATVGYPRYASWRTSFNVLTHNHFGGSDSGYIRNTGYGRMEATITANPISPTSDWLTVTPNVLYLMPGESLQVVVTARSDTSNNGVFDYFGSADLRTNACPDTIVRMPVTMTVLAADDPTPAIDRYELSPAYPNPFNATTTLTFALPRESHVRLAVFDVLGREAAVAVNGDLAAGKHSISFDASGLPSGVYFYRLEAGSFSDIGKMMLLK
jgi:hypothetical protein